MNHVCQDANGEWYGWGRVLDYIGVGWEDAPMQGEQMSLEIQEEGIGNSYETNCNIENEREERP